MEFHEGQKVIGTKNNSYGITNRFCICTVISFTPGYLRIRIDNLLPKHPYYKERNSYIGCSCGVNPEVFIPYFQSQSELMDISNYNK
jgi:hypothetical protein